MRDWKLHRSMSGNWQLESWCLSETLTWILKSIKPTKLHNKRHTVFAATHSHQDAHAFCCPLGRRTVLSVCVVLLFGQESGLIWSQMAGDIVYCLIRPCDSKLEYLANQEDDFSEKIVKQLLIITIAGCSFIALHKITHNSCNSRCYILDRKEV